MSNDHGQTDLGNRSGDFVGVRGGAHHHPGLNWIAPLNEVNEMLATAQEAVLVGRADQYRLGDMLIPHVLTRLLHLSKVRCAGLFSADLTPVGGHATRNYGECLLEMHGSRMNLIHFGGETLSLDLVDGYRNGADELEAERFESLSLISARPELLRYARRRSGQISDFAYVL
ncbi:MAG TPA: hypothetical protein PLA50_07070, partial [Bacteroidia bacterium]|nr:hypothetical protein [Bacteroidia bacterium]